MISETREQQAQILESFLTIAAPEVIAALRAGAQALREQPQWLPIAEHDGGSEPVLIWIADEQLDAGGYTVQAQYVAWDGPPPAEYRDGWCNGWDGAYISDDEVITHFHPLPSAPAPSEDQ